MNLHVENAFTHQVSLETYANNFLLNHLLLQQIAKESFGDIK